jgi:hypothetical protein
MALPLSLLGMLMRSKKNYQMPLVETVKQSLQDLSIILADDDNIDVDSAMLAIHTLFLMIWTTSGSHLCTLLKLHFANNTN